MPNVNPFQIIQMIKGGSNPQQLLMSILEQQMGGTPMGNNLINMARNGDSKGLEQVARNLCEQRGLNYDSEMANFRRNIGL